MATDHNCIEHGHFCSICEERLFHLQEAQKRRRRVESWAWNNTALDCAREIVASEVDPKEWYGAMRAHGFGDRSISYVIDLVDQLAQEAS